MNMPLTARALPDLAQAPRVLLLAKVHPYPPATAGDAVYSRGIIESLSRTTRLTVLCADSGADRSIRPDIDWHITGPQRGGRVGSVLSRWPLISWKGATRDYLAELDRLLEQKWDAIILDNLGLAHALPRAERYRTAHPGTRLVYISHEYEYPTRAAKYDSYGMSLPKRLLAGRDLAKVRRSEEALLRRCDIVTVINTADLAPFRKIAPERKYLPLLPGYEGQMVSERRIDAEVPRRVLVLGGRRSEQKRQILLDWMAAAHDKLHAEGIEMVVAGDMDEGLRSHLRKSYPHAQVLGFVDDLEALFASARMGIIADTTGGGFKLRLLTQVFQRLPIVGLKGAISGLPTPEGEGYLGADSLKQLVSLVCEVIDDTDRLNALHEKVFSDSAVAFSWEARAEALTRTLAGDAGELS
ncbi:Glycosyl transferases group 1 [Salipiger thiooxidans]|uniref:Glycosyl transferases group 1 n=1 Tax=Salipiger thiooxidans TaxID=282683 RepID=A0A1G7LLG4_9RHOB|nr:glycosyltransferase [Salipiger thiooxidans]SDF50253.1 Glycosyl transferases group 1 [Salipiger thiooxidans]